MDYSIGQVAKQLGCNVQTIRYYEQIGLIAAPQRTAGQQRRYRSADLDRLMFVRHARELGFSLDAIRALLRLSNQVEEPCHLADQIAAEQLAEVRSRIARLRALEDELVAMVDHRAHSTVANCQVIEVLRNHALCQHDHHEPPTSPAAP
ncbi:MerR family transcriptional regulator [Saccharospirillum sp. MSK14-1]|uniref:MerR family transcriptional regulator n=1 Tax=Saccharospirillum sp. MSK14-1 TaxID=1897632 RepID=UPI000D34981B|nr:helix-turn-helix domain-containing protein [Saccharospirillum sp. MSK14-1]PTY38285.1 MerR family transcriptional regulator [Saccharospirillum sp. MSK14-1]